jgi:enoyl-CoA hydratase/carnithine racemase
MGIENQILLKENPQPGVLRLIMNDPKRKNALSENMIDALTDTIVSSSEDKLIKVIIIAANGNVFSSGHDLKELTLARDHEDDGNSYFMKLFDVCSSLMQSIVDCPKPIIAEVNGVATAAGCQLVASCDLAISSNNSKFATPGVNLGLFCSTPMVALSRNVSKKDAMKMLLTGDMVDAKEAKNISLINEHVSEDELSQTVMKLAQKIANKSSMTIKTGKKAFYKQIEMNLSDAYEYTSRVMAKNMLKKDAKEGINSFLEKRDPNWSDS